MLFSLFGLILLSASPKVGSLDIFLFLYCLNLVMVGIDGTLLLYYKRKEA
jgi:hypothetical protein